jgi:putative peptide zinc metalloprotease protein
MVGLAGAYFLTGQQLFLAAILVAHIEIFEQLMPAVRLDGYFILGDLAGVPDLFGKIRPILLSMRPGRPARPEVADLKRSARVIVTGWVLAMVPLLLGELGYLLWNLPRILDSALRSLNEQITGTGVAFADGRIPTGIVGVIGILLLICPLAGAAYLVARMVRLLGRSVARAVRGNTGRKAVLCLAVPAGSTALAGTAVQGITPQNRPTGPAQAPGVHWPQPGVSTEPSITPPAITRPPTVAERPSDSATDSPPPSYPTSADRRPTSSAT